MAKFELTPRTAFGATEPRTISHGAATLIERPDIAIASVAARQGREAVVAEHIATLCNEPCPVAAYAPGKEFSAFWSGPAQWFVMAEHGAHELLASALKTDLGDTSSVTEQTDGWVVYDLDGSSLDRILEKLCNINLTAFADGQVQRTVIEHISCFVLCQTAGRSYRLLCARSFAGSFSHAVETAMKSAAAVVA